LTRGRPTWSIVWFEPQCRRSAGFSPEKPQNTARNWCVDGGAVKRYKAAFQTELIVVTMAHHKSAQKRIRRTKTRTAINRARVSRIRTYIKNVETAVASGDREAAAAALKKAEPELMRGVRRGVMKQNTASRRVSKLSRRVKTMSI